MDVIPVIDLKGGAVVRARLGRREAYAPIATPLARTSAPLDVVAGLMTVHPFRTFYVADLDAIQSRGGHEAVISRLETAYPETTFWVDAGIGGADEARAWLARHPRAHLALGSESLPGVEPLAALADERRIVLSLDFRGGAPLGPEDLFGAVHMWPPRVIAMTLDRVGADCGPDIDRLADIAARAPGARLYAAGGVRGRDDLMRLAQAGVCGALVASALHNGRLTGAELAALEGLDAAKGADMARSK